MGKTLRFGTNVEPRLTSRIDRFVLRRRTSAGYDRAAELALADHARQVALEVTPCLQPRVVSNTPVFGKSFKPDHVAKNAAEAKAWMESRKRS